MSGDSRAPLLCSATLAAGRSPSCAPLVALGVHAFARLRQRRLQTVTTYPAPQQLLYLCARRMLEIFHYVPLAMGVRIGVAGCSIIARGPPSVAAVGLAVEPVVGGHGPWRPLAPLRRGDPGGAAQPFTGPRPVGRAPRRWLSSCARSDQGGVSIPKAGAFSRVLWIR